MAMQAAVRLLMPLASLVWLIGAAPAATQPVAREIPLEVSGGTYVVPVLINDTITLKFTLDGGAADVTIPEDVVMTLIRAGTITAADLREPKSYSLADGSTVTHLTFIIRSLKVGDVQLANIMGSVAGRSGSLLLGQSFLSRLSSWSIDNRRRVLVFNSDISRPPQPTPYYTPQTAYGQLTGEGVTCADGHVQSLASGPPFCSSRGGIAGYRRGEAAAPLAPSGGGSIICRDGSRQSLSAGPPFCQGRGGAAGFR